MTTGNNTLNTLKMKMQNFKSEIEDLQTKIDNKNVNIKEEIDKKNKMDKEIEIINQKIKEIEETNDFIDSKLQASSILLEDISKKADINERAKRGLENRQQNNDGKIEKLETQLRIARDLRNAADIKFEEISVVLIQTEHKLTDAEEIFEEASKKFKETEIEMHGVSCTLKSLKLNESKATVREDYFEKKISKITEQLNEAKIRLTNEESENHKFTNILQSLEDEIENEKDNHQKLKNDLEKIMDEFQNI